MLSAMVWFSLHFRGVVIALAVGLLGYGLYTLSLATYDVFPEFAPPQVVIQTEAPGLAPEQVEVLVTQVLENTLNGLAGIASLRSGSVQGLSVVTVTFHPSSDIYRDRQAVAERLASLVGQFPQGVQAPVMTPLTSSTSVVLALARRATGVRGAGFIETANQRILLQTQGQSLAPEHLAQTVLVHHNGANVTLGEVAQVVEAPEPPLGAAAIMGEPGVILSVSSQYGANTLAVTQQVEQALEELRPTLAGVYGDEGL